MQDDGFKECPFCEEKIRREAVKCRFCGEWLEQIPEPATPESAQDGFPAKSIEIPSATTPQNEVDAPQPLSQGISPAIVKSISLGFLVLCPLLIAFAFKDVDFSKRNPDRVTARLAAINLVASILGSSFISAAILAWIVCKMARLRKGYGFLTFSVLCTILTAYNAHSFRIGMDQIGRKSPEGVTASPTSSAPASSVTSSVSFRATNATNGLGVVSGAGFQNMPLGCSTEVVEAIMGAPQDKKVYGTDVYYAYKLSNRLADLERRGVLHNEKDIAFVFDQATLKLKKIFIEDSFAVKTDRGIEFGDAIEKVLKLYGTPTQTYPANIENALNGWLAFRNDGITFDFHDGVVTGFDIIGKAKH